MVKDTSEGRSGSSIRIHDDNGFVCDYTVGSGGDVMARRKLTPELAAEIREDYLAGMTWERLSEKHNAPYSWIRTSVPADRKRDKSITDREVEAIRADYLAGMTWANLRTKHKRTPYTIERCVSDLIGRRVRGRTNRPSDLRGKEAPLPMEEYHRQHRPFNQRVVRTTSWEIIEGRRS